MQSEKKVLILQGGWAGHEPVETSKRFADMLTKHGYTCTISDTQDVLADLDMLMKFLTAQLHHPICVVSPIFSI